MKITSQQRIDLNNLMVRLFPKRDDLKLFLFKNLGFRLDSRVSPEAPLDNSVGEVIEIFEPENTPHTDMRKLLRALRDTFTSSTELARLVDEIMAMDAQQDTMSAVSDVDDLVRVDGDQGGRPSPSVFDDKIGRGRQDRRTQADVDTIVRLAGDQEKRQGGGSPEKAKKGILGDKGQTPTKSTSGVSKQLQLTRQKAGELVSAMNTLRTLKSELDRALVAFVDTYAGEVVSDLIDVEASSDTIACVESHTQMIELSGDRDQFLTELRLLLRDVTEGIEAAERRNDYVTVGELSGSAASACLAAASKIEGKEQMLLSGVAPYWRMRQAYAAHRRKSLAKSQ